jgi:hypothetical protein
MAQNLVVALLVAGCFVYALWTLAPKAPRSRLAVALLKLPLPLVLQKPLTAAMRQQGGCGCDGCGRSVGPKAKPGTDLAGSLEAQGLKPIAFVRGSHAKKPQR